MMRIRGARAFTLAEMMIAMTGSLVVIGALLLSAIGLQRTLHSAESYAACQADQRRLLDYVCRDLRRAIGVASTTSVGGVAGVPLKGTTLTVDGDTALLITMPAYYQSQSPSDTTYDQPLAVVAADNYVDYGQAGVHAPGVHVIFRKQFDSIENCVCFFRLEDATSSIIVRHAENLDLQISIDPDGLTSSVSSTFRPTHISGTVPPTTEREQLLLRNLRKDQP